MRMDDLAKKAYDGLEEGGIGDDEVDPELEAYMDKFIRHAKSGNAAEAARCLKMFVEAVK